MDKEKKERLSLDFYMSLRQKSLLTGKIDPARKEIEEFFRRDQKFIRKLNKKIKF